MTDALCISSQKELDTIKMLARRVLHYCTMKNPSVKAMMVFGVELLDELEMMAVVKFPKTDNDFKDSVQRRDWVETHPTVKMLAMRIHNTSMKEFNSVRQIESAVTFLAQV